MGRSCFPSHIGLYSNIVWNCTNIYTKNIAKKRWGRTSNKRTLFLHLPVTSEKLNGGDSLSVEGFDRTDLYWVRVFSFPSLCLIYFVCLNLYSTLNATFKIRRFYRLVESCRGAGEWRTGDAWGGRETAHRVGVRVLVPTASPEPASNHPVPFLMFSTLIFLPYFHVQ